MAACDLLQDVDKLRHAVGLKAYSSQQPLEEFRLEANRAFLVLLDSYRDAVVSRLMVPDLNFSLLLDHQEAWDDVAADGQQQAQQKAVPAILPGVQLPSDAVGTHPTGSSGSHRGQEAGDLLQPLGAKNGSSA